MSFPQTLTPAAPSGIDSPRLGDDEIRALKQFLADLFGFPVSPSSISAAIGAVSTGGKLTITNGLWNGDVLGVVYGGTGLASGTSGGILGFTATGTLASSVALTANALVLGAGAGATPTPMGSLGTTTTLLHGNAAGAPTFGAVILTADVSGICPGANGGTANGFFAVSGPTTSLKTFTFPDASSTILYSGGALGTPSSGVGTNLTGIPAGSILAGSFGAGAYVIDTSLTVPTLLGGTGTTSDLNLKTTSGVGAAGADMHFLVGNNGATEAITILNNGNVGIGTTGPALKLHISSGVQAAPATSGSTQAGGIARLRGDDDSVLDIGFQTDNFWIQGTNQNDLSLTRSLSLNPNGGSVGIGMIPTVQFELSGSVGQKASGTTWSNPSDARLKEDIRDYTDGLDMIRKVRPVRYALNGLAGTPKGTKGISVIAQEMIEVMPYTIETYKAKLNPDDTEDTELYRFEASALTFALINAVKELAQRVEVLERLY